MPTIFDPHVQKRGEKMHLEDQKPSKQSNTQQSSAVASSRDTIFQGVAKEDTNTSQENQDKFSKLLKETDTILLTVQTVFPMDFFPDILTIDPVKLTFTRKTFFYTSYTQSIPIVNLVNVDVESSVMFAALRINFISYPTQEILIKPLWKKDAQKARDILAGLMITSKQNLDLEKMPTPNVQTLMHLGTSDS